MKPYEFILEFKLPEELGDPEEHLDALFEAGCDDAVIGTGVYGYISLHFTRESESSLKALKSAISNVMGAIPGAVYDSASTGLVIK